MGFNVRNSTVKRARSGEFLGNLQRLGDGCGDGLGYRCGDGLRCGCGNRLGWWCGNGLGHGCVNGQRFGCLDILNCWNESWNETNHSALNINQVVNKIRFFILGINSYFYLEDDSKKPVLITNWDKH